MSLIEDQISTLHLLMAMYPLPSELALAPETATYLQDPTSLDSQKAFSLTLYLTIDGVPSPLELSIVLPLDPETPSPYGTVSIRQPPWLPRAAYDELLELTTSLEVPVESSAEYILPLLELLPRLALELYSKHRHQTPPADASETAVEGEGGEEERVWFWFPSLSSKEKRRDLVEFAERAGITGFVLAGKPGLLCVEGNGRIVDKYMASIKSESWADIPAFQKKVTERLRLPIPSGKRRLFKDMTDITDLITHRGTYNHRGDMSETKAMMDEFGVGEEFATVILKQSNG